MLLHGDLPVFFTAQVGKFRVLRRTGFALSLTLAASTYATDPRTYILMPVGTDLTEARYVTSESSVPLGSGKVEMRSGMSLVKHAHYFDLMGDLAAIQVALPYANLHRTEGASKSSESGWGDSSILFGWGFFGMPALSADALRTHDRNGFSAATSLFINFPSGEYRPGSALNVGANRYAYRPELQLAWRQDAVLLEAIGGFSRYGLNTEYRGSNRLQQGNLYHLEFHASRNLAPWGWGGVDLYYAKGGGMELNHVKLNNAQQTLSGGVNASLYVRAGQFIKLLYQNTLSKSAVSSGTRSFSVSYNILW